MSVPGTALAVRVFRLKGRNPLFCDVLNKREQWPQWSLARLDKTPEAIFPLVLFRQRGAIGLMRIDQARGITMRRPEIQTLNPTAFRCPSLSPT